MSFGRPIAFYDSTDKGVLNSEDKVLISVTNKEGKETGPIFVSVDFYMKNVQGADRNLVVELARRSDPKINATRFLKEHPLKRA